MTVPSTIIAPTIPPNEPPAGNSVKLLEKVKRLPAYESLMRVSKFKDSEISLKEVESKTSTLGETYSIAQLEQDLQNFCMMIYKNFAKTTT